MTRTSSVSIAGFAACTSLGYSLESTLSAMGAGLSNFTNTAVPNEFGHPAVAASLIQPHVGRSERLVALFEHALEDLERLLPRERLANVPVLIGVASDLTIDEKATMRRVVQEHGLHGETAWYPYGRASTFAALAAGMEQIAGGSHPLVLVGGIDSLCAPATVASLVRAGRVLSPYTEGTIPGEAAAFAVLVRSQASVVDPRSSVLLEGVAVNRAATPFTEARVVSAEALTSVFRTLREGGARRVDRIIGAHSGEGYFGRAFAHAYLREVEMMPEPLSVEVIADRVGDVGAAAGILGTAFGVYLMVQDGREQGGRALAYSESDTGEVGAAIVDGSPTFWERSMIADAHLAKD